MKLTSQFSRITLSVLSIALSISYSFGVQKKQPNILFIMLDDLGKEWVESYGAEGINEIYNLSKDLSEEHDLTKGSNNNLEVEQVLMKQLNTWLTQDTPGWKPKYPQDRKTGKSLSAPSAK